MRIFTAVRHSNNPQYFYGDLWSNNFKPALERSGHEVVDSETDLLPASRFMDVPGKFTKEEKEVRERITDSMIDEVRRHRKNKKIDLFLSYFYNAHFDPDGFDAIHKLGIPTINFFCNSTHQFDLVSDIAKKVNFSWHAEKYAKEKYIEVGANPVWVQMGADPGIYHPVWGQKRQKKCCFIGQRYADRGRWVAALIGANIPLHLYGPGWNVAQMQNMSERYGDEMYLGRKKQVPGRFDSYVQEVRKNFEVKGWLGGISRSFRQFRYSWEARKGASVFAPFASGAVPFHLQYLTFARYEVVLNFSNVWSDGRPGSVLTPHVRLRDFEAPMCRTCYLTGDTEEIKEFYEAGKEIDTYKSPEELASKAAYYLERPDEAEQLREAGYRRAIRDHTWEKRFRELFDKTGMS